MEKVAEDLKQENSFLMFSGKDADRNSILI